MRSFSQVKGRQEWKAYSQSFWAWYGITERTCIPRKNTKEYRKPNRTIKLRWALTRPEHTFEFWPAINKRLTRWPGFDLGIFWPKPIRFFWTRKGKKLKNLGFLGKSFQIQTQIKDGWPDPDQRVLPLTHIKRLMLKLKL